MSTANLLLTPVAVLLVLSTFSLADVALNSQNVKHLQNIARSMDRTADPCNDFYQYACGNGMKFMHNGITSEVTYITSIANSLKKYYPNTRKVKQNYAEKLIIYYQLCKKSRDLPLLPFLNEIKPNSNQEWPFLADLQAYEGQDYTRAFQPWTTNDIDLIALLAKLISYGLNNVLVRHKRVDVPSDRAYIFVTPPDTAPVAANELATLLSSLKLPRYVMEKYFNEFVETHQYWQNIYNDYDNSDEYIIRTYDQLKAGGGILSQLAKFLKEMYPPPAKIEDQYFYFHPGYVKYFLSKQWQPDEARKFCNYLMFRFIFSLQEIAGPNYYLGSSEEKFTLAFNYVYYKNFYLPHKKEHDAAFAATVKSLYKHFAETVAENRLDLSDQQLKEILTKLGNLRTNIGNLPENITESMVEEYYSVLPDLDIDNFYKTELLARKHAHLENLMCPEDMICNKPPPHLFYSKRANMIYFPFTALVPPIHDWAWHPLFVMSILGNAAGHELVHAIDSSVLNMEKFTPSFGEHSPQVPAINASLTCLSQQYPTNTINERLADVIGAQLAFRTYSREFGSLPSFTTTPWQQLYFLSLAQMYCGKGTEKDRAHDGKSIRLWEIVMNSKEFAEAFQCPSGSKMNPVKKCSYI